MLTWTPTFASYLSHIKGYLCSQLRKFLLFREYFVHRPTIIPLPMGMYTGTPMHSHYQLLRCTAESLDLLG